jgi:hypothetical protein
MHDAANGPEFWALFHRGSAISALRSQGVVYDHGVTLESRSSVTRSLRCHCFSADSERIPSD